MSYKSDRHDDQDFEKLVGTLAIETGKRKASAAKMLLHRGAARKSAARLKVKR